MHKTVKESYEWNNERKNRKLADTSSIFLERWPDRFESFAVWQKTMADRLLNTLSFEDVRILTSIEIERERERERDVDGERKILFSSTEKVRVRKEIQAVRKNLVTQEFSIIQFHNHWLDNSKRTRI